MDYIRATVSNFAPSIFCVTESWLQSNHSSSDIFIDDYVCIRDDRKDGRIGGGVVVWISSRLHFSRYAPTGHPEGTNSVWIILPSFRAIFICIYCPPDRVTVSSNNILTFLTDNLDSILTKYPNYSVYITGDFNHLNTSPLSDSFDLLQIVNDPTRGSSLLDLALLSHSIADHFEVNVGPPISTSDHATVHLRSTSTLSISSGKTTIVHDLRSSNIINFVTSLEDTDWTRFYNSDASVHEKCEIFNDIILSCMQANIPSSTVIMTSKDKPYITPVIKLLINKRWNAFRAKDFARYDHFSTKVKHLLEISKHHWAKKAAKNTKELWNVTNEVRGTRSSRSSNLDNLLSQFASTREAVESINSSFTSFLTGGLPPTPPDSDCQWCPILEVHQVQHALKTIKPDKASGCDRVPSILYKRASHVLAGPLAHIYNLSIQSRTFPKPWKTGHITPVPKTSPPNVNDLRPITLLPIPAKVFEKLILNSGIKELLINGFGKNQFGSRPKSSTTLALISLHDYITNFLEDANISGVALLAYDFSKAFDQLSHKTIIDTMSTMNLPPGFILWSISYLCNRQQSVRINDCISTPLPVTSGIPQGSLFGPFFFNIVIGTLDPLNQTTKLVKYVDDCTFVVPLNSVDSTQVYSEHNHMLEWARSVYLNINLRKSKIMCINTSASTILPQLPDMTSADELKLLGVTFTSDLKWDKHFDLVVRKASSRLYTLRILRPLLSRENLHQIYCGLIRSLLEYSSPLFIGMLLKDRSRLDRLQQRAHNLICSFGCTCSLMSPLDDRRMHATCKLISDCTSPDSLLHDLCPPKSNRSDRLILPHCHTQRRLSSFFPQACILYNASLHPSS